MKIPSRNFINKQINKQANTRITPNKKTYHSHHTRQDGYSCESNDQVDESYVIVLACLKKEIETCYLSRLTCR
ncbi:hypothetical protein EYC80_001716 [Monilinia laxa]|uniref:Uncharacterized protein n=1 Tax=Monilinia laxa TaxID=61186 RepID=A0A5N6K5T1_MONLA|nr:hypothetical protein EYC80_001716 [Monilinia laxa]